MSDGVAYPIAGDTRKTYPKAHPGAILSLTATSSVEPSQGGGRPSKPAPFGGFRVRAVVFG